MQIYKNLSGKSNVNSYEIGEDFIIVNFNASSKSGASTYKYTNSFTGANHVEQLKQLAVAGIGLNSYINKNVRKLYESKY